MGENTCVLFNTCLNLFCLFYSLNSHLNFVFNWIITWTSVWANFWCCIKKEFVAGDRKQYEKHTIKNIKNIQRKKQKTNSKNNRKIPNGDIVFALAFARVSELLTDCPCLHSFFINRFFFIIIFHKNRNATSWFCNLLKFFWYTLSKLFFFSFFILSFFIVLLSWI